jgi:hypothetical protein
MEGLHQRNDHPLARWFDEFSGHLARVHPWMRWNMDEVTVVACRAGLVRGSRNQNQNQSQSQSQNQNQGQSQSQSQIGLGTMSGRSLT